MWLGIGLLLCLAGQAADLVQRDHPVLVHELEADRAWLLNLPDFEPFNASGLLRPSRGGLLTVNDRGYELFTVRFQAGTNVADLVMNTRCFTDDQFRPFTRQKHGRYDIEGLAEDGQGRFYLVEEADRWVLRCDPRTGQVERLAIDWAPVADFFHPTDRNASFEGIAVGGERLYLANERLQARIVVVSLQTLKVIDHFQVKPSGTSWVPSHYSDLSWYDGVLFVLMREAHRVLAVDPETHAVLAEYDYRAVELAPDHEFRRTWFFTGVMEGLAVEAAYIWLVTDNNNQGRRRYPQDHRPMLFRCPRPPLPVR